MRRPIRPCRQTEETTLNPRRRQALGVLATTLMQLPTAVRAQGWPDRPVRFVVGYPPGGAADQVARVLAAKLETLWSQSVPIDYRPGAGAAISAELVARAPADGYTMLLTDSGPLTIIPNLRKVPYDPVDGFTPLGFVGGGGLVVLAHPSVPANDLPELVKLLKAAPGKYQYSTSGIGSPHHLAAELFKAQADVDIGHVPYKGAAQALADLIAGQIPISFATISPAAPHVRSGKIRAIAVTGAQRSSVLPEVRTIAEQGYAGYDARFWQAVVAPPKLPPAAADKLQQSLRTALADPDVLAGLQKLGIETPPAMSAAQFRDLVQRDLSKWAAVVKRANISTES